MRYRANWIALGLSIWLMGCSNPVPTVSSNGTTDRSPDATPPTLQAEKKPTQMLPISAQATTANHLIQLEVAQTPEQQEIGLMNRTSLPDDRGMLFLFNPPQLVAFWMKNTLIPLDMVFLRDGQVKAIAANVPPCKADPCPTYPSLVPINQVIELRGGRAAELRIKVGDRVTIQPIKQST